MINHISECSKLSQKEYKFYLPHQLLGGEDNPLAVVQKIEI